MSHSLTPEQSAQYNPLKIKLQGLGPKIKGIVEQGRLVQTDRSQLFLFKGMYKALLPYYTTFTNTWDKLTELVASWEVPAIFPSQHEKTLLQNVERYYYEACAIYEEYMNPTPGTLSQSVNRSSLNESRTVRARLPQINLPTFSGKPADWPLFRDTFCSLIHHELTISDIEKFLFLTSSLQGPPLSLIKSIDVAEANYDQAWKLLNDTYNDKRRLASSYLRNVTDFVAFKGRPSANALQHLITTVGESIQSFKKLKIPDGEDFILLTLFLRCLDPGTRKAFERQHAALEYPTVKHLTDFLRVEWNSADITNADIIHPSIPIANARDVPYRTGKAPKPHASLLVGQRSDHPTKPRGPSLSHHPAKSSSRCPVCNCNHSLYQCAEFKRLTPSEKRSSLEKWRGCTNCLSSYHSTHACPSPRSCQSCSRRHHTWLHSSPSSPPEASGDPSPNTPLAQISKGLVLGSMSSVSAGLLGTTIVEIKDSLGQYHKIRAVLDCGSQHSLISVDCCQKLDLVILKSKQQLSGIGQTPLQGTLGQLVCHIRSMRGTKSDLVTNSIVVKHITGHLPDREIPANNRSLYSSFALADDEFWRPGRIDFLIGGDVFYDIVTGPPIVIAPNVPRVLPTIFGFVIAGPLTSKDPGCSTSLLTLQIDKSSHNYESTTSDNEPEEDIKPILERFWEVEEVPKRGIISEEDKFCEDHYASTHYRLASGRYVVSLPLKDSVSSLCNPIQHARTRLYTLESKLQKQPLLKAEYHQFLRDYLTLGHMQLSAAGTSSYTIPHHAVTKIHNDQLKLRVVFDASCTTISGSLNDHMYTGPKLQADIAEIVTNFRIHPLVFTADIVKMYRQIHLASADRKYQHILWRFDPSDTVQDYELCTVTYGTKAAPFLAQRTIKQLVLDDGASYPLASRTLSEDIYVDDIVTGAKSLASLFQLKEELVTLLNRGGFKLSKWASNCPRLLDTLPKEDIASSNIPLVCEDDPKIKLLGIQWNQHEDVFSYEITPPSLKMTKRAMLSAIARIYDPLGFLSPVTFLAKTILQEMWIAKLDWDQPGPPSTCHKWHLFLEQLPCLKELKIPRLVMPATGMIQYTLVGFCDASLRGYSAVCYLHSSMDQTCTITLLRAKTKLAPVKPMSVPRLELSGALLLCRLFQTLSDFIFRLNITTVTFFTDSQTVLGWLSTPPTRCNTFVAHRVVEILEHTQRSQWNYVQSEQNPADCSSRGISPRDLIHHPLWWAGASWLSLPRESWPSPVIPESNDLPELRSVKLVALTTLPKPDWDKWTSRFSSYLKVVRIVAYVLRFGARCRKTTNEAGPISLPEFRHAEKGLIRVIQHQFLSPPILTEDKMLLRLRPFVDDEGLTRVGGRLHSAPLPYAAKHPILLPSKCHLSKILVDHYHVAYLHAGPSALQTLIRTKYWILAARNLVRQRLFQCLTCYKASRLPQPPLMGNLPSSRMHEGHAFINVGVDLSGPFFIRYSSKRKAAVEKAYLCLFICMATKAIHLEVVSSCSTKAFLAAFTRFTSRRGKPSCVYSDCGTNFVGARNRLLDLYTVLRTNESQKEIITYTVAQEIEWCFNPPSSPHFGGLWEAAIKSCKAILRKVIGDTPLTFEELTTLFCKIEGVLNSRPLMPLTSDPETLECLTPGHFLIGRPITAVPEEQQPREVTPLQRWKLVQQTAQHFWNRWRLDYLNQLQQRKKWVFDRPNLHIGDLVIMKEPNVPQRTWPLARIVRTHPGKDGVVRVVTIRSSTGVFKRSAVKLVPLTPINNCDSQ